MAKVTIDGAEVEVQDGLNIIEAAKAADVHVPHFCYHPSLTVVGQCRMCLVEVEGMPKLQAGCSTTVREGMKIWVWNQKVEKARRGQMEFLLINHPLDCPICDKAGECPLQDYSFNYGSVTSRYGEVKRTYPGMDRTAIGPHVLQNMNRCIHCTRCIRFCAEISGTSELAFFKRGAATQVGVYPGVPLDNWMSACVTDVCPTGALTTREFRFESRVWNLDSADSVCNGCDVGCNIFIGHRSGQIFRYRPRVNPDVNDHWLCDYGRFSYERYDTDRVVVPKVRTEEDTLGISTWGEALDAIETALRNAGDSLRVIASAHMTNEEAALAKRLFGELLNAKIDVMVDAIGPIKMKSRTEWLLGTQAAPNFRGVSAILECGGHSAASASGCFRCNSARTRHDHRQSRRRPGDRKNPPRRRPPVERRADHGLGGAPRQRADPGPPRAESRRAVRPDPGDGRRAEVHPQGRRHPGAGQQVALHHRADVRPHPGADDDRRRAVGEPVLHTEGDHVRPARRRRVHRRRLAAGDPGDSDRRRDGEVSPQDW